MIIFFCSNHNTTTNYARWQLLYSEYSNYAAFVNNGIKDIFKTEFLLTETTSQGCARLVESYMPLAVTRPFVEELITKESINKVNISHFMQLASYIPYTWNYWQVEYLAICSKNAIGETFNWWF